VRALSCHGTNLLVNFRRAILERKDRKKQPSAKRGDGDVEMVDVRPSLLIVLSPVI
jgi:hypothetical protein